MRCKNCKYFYLETRLYVSIPDKQIGRCSNPLLVDDIESDNNECPDNGIYATCDEGRGELEVGENFGCIHFKENG